MQSNDSTPRLPPDLIDAIGQLPDYLVERLRSIQGRTLGNETFGARLGHGPIVYWTHHAQRTDENPALDVARILAQSLDRPLLVYQGLSQRYRFASDRHHLFQLESACDLQHEYSNLGVQYTLHVETRNHRPQALVQLARMACLIITEDFPGEPTDRWTQRIAAMGRTPVLAVDTACVVPMHRVGRAFDRAFAFRDATKRLYSERIDRQWPKLNLPSVARFEGPLPFTTIDLEAANLLELVAQCEIDHGIPHVADTRGGTIAGYERWSTFVKGPMNRYAAKRNDPCSGVASRMSAYLHYGMVSPMRLAREAYERNAEKYLDELLIWRELAYGYCFYRSDFKQLATIPAWALHTLREHERDPREAIYSWETLARGKTHDRLWNACQLSLLRHGELHNNVRMTWGKALLRWTRNACDALRLLIDLNHRFALDGRDPASYGGILWCLGQFDRPFEPEQPIVGTVRDRPLSEHAKRIKLDSYERHIQRPIGRREVRVAIIGAGIAGAMCARTLSDQGIAVMLLEKSRGPGGRCATRRNAQRALFDHGPPYLVFRDPRWKLTVESWLQDQVLEQWTGRVVRFEGQKMRDITGEEMRWVGVHGMNGIGKHLANDLTIHPLHRVISVDRTADHYRVTAERIDHTVQIDGSAGSMQFSEFGPFDAVVWNMPPAQIKPLLPQECDWSQGLKDVTMNPQWVVMLSLDSKWDVPFDGAWLSDETIMWIGRESSKPGRTNQGESWMIHATVAWSQAHLELQPEMVCEAIVRCLRSFARGPMPEIVTATAHRWRYAQAAANKDGLPVEVDCLWDSARRLGACGDWLRGPGVEGALTSGRSMAGRILSWITEGKTRSPKPTRYEQLRLF